MFVHIIFLRHFTVFMDPYRWMFGSSFKPLDNFTVLIKTIQMFPKLIHGTVGALHMKQRATRKKLFVVFNVGRAIDTATLQR